MNDANDAGDEPPTIDCDVHGTSRTGVVCRHMLRPTDGSLGFVENSSDPDDPQAWCDACEAMFVQEQAMTDAFLAFNDFAVVCIACYAQLKQLHSTPA